MSTTPITPPSPDDPAALARELAAEIRFLLWPSSSGARQCNLHEKRAEQFAAILLPTLERLVRERDEAREQWRMSSVCRELQANLSAVETERHDLQMRAERAEAMLRKAGRALTGSKHVTYEDLDEYLRKLEAERDAAQSAEREGRALLGEAEHALACLSQDYMTLQKPGSPIGFWNSNAMRVQNEIRAYLARGAEGKPASKGHRFSSLTQPLGVIPCAPRGPVSGW